MAKQTIYFDMDGTIANLYAVDGWLEKLRSFDPSPYKNAVPMVDMSRLAKYIHRAQKDGYRVGIISWLSKETTDEYDAAVCVAKMDWLKKHLPSVKFDEVKFASHGIPKHRCVTRADRGILFDDEENNRTNWTGLALPPDQIFEFFRCIL
jgi:5'(3')-deoxyribonucleotidase